MIPLFFPVHGNSHTCRLPYRPEGRHGQDAGSVEDRFEALEEGLHRFQRALDRARGGAAILAVAVLAEEPVVEDLGRPFFAREDRQREGRFRRQLGDRSRFERCSASEQEG